VTKPKWQRILDLEAQAKGLPPPYSSNPDQAPVQQIANDVGLARNVGLAVLIGKAVPGMFALWLIYLIFFR
jgi:hypothetical protein